MAITDEELTKIRNTGSYRAAVWLTRWNFVPVLGWFWLLSVKKPPTFLVVGVWLVVAVGVAGALVLLRRAGIPFVRRGLSWHVEDKRILARLFWDVLWKRRA